MESKRRVYLEIGSARLLDIRVILDDQYEIYSGMVEDAPEEVKKLKYSKVESKDKMTYYAYNDAQ